MTRVADKVNLTDYTRYIALDHTPSTRSSKVSQLPREIEATNAEQTTYYQPFSFSFSLIHTYLDPRSCRRANTEKGFWKMDWSLQSVQVSVDSVRTNHKMPFFERVTRASSCSFRASNSKHAHLTKRRLLARSSPFICPPSLTVAPRVVGSMRAIVVVAKECVKSQIFNSYRPHRVAN